MNANIMKTQYMTWNVTFMLWRNIGIFYFKTFWPNYNLDLRSYGQLLFFLLWLIFVLPHLKCVVISCSMGYVWRYKFRKFILLLVLVSIWKLELCLWFSMGFQYEFCESYDYLFYFISCSGPSSDHTKYIFLYIIDL